MPGVHVRRRTIAIVMGAATLAAVLCVAAAATFGAGGKKFPGALSYTSSNVSWQQAFSHYGIDLNGPTGQVHYVGFVGEGYTLYAYFPIGCNSVPAFARDSSLQKVPSMYDLDISVFSHIEAFAESQDHWKALPGDVWYTHNSANPDAEFGAVVQEVKGQCTVFVGS